MLNKVLAQNTLQIIFYSLLKLPLLEYEPKRAVFMSFPLNANELVFPEKRAEFQKLMLQYSSNTGAVLCK